MKKYLKVTYLIFELSTSGVKLEVKNTFFLCLDRRKVMCAEDIQRVTLRAGHSLYNQDHQKKRSFADLARDEDDEPKRFRRDFMTDDNQDDYIDNRISLAGKS